MNDETVINPEVLIELVEKRPCLWDRNSEHYRDSVVRYSAWSDVCSILRPNYETWDKKEKNNYVKLVMRRWMNLRTAWKRTLVVGRKYAYHNNIKFLVKNINIGNEKQNNKLEDESDDISESDLSTSFWSKKKKTKDEHEFLENPHISFIKGLMPNLNKLDDDEMLEFQMGVIKLLRDIRRKNTTEIESSGHVSMPSSRLETINLKNENVE